jgi:hypothetical protein
MFFFYYSLSQAVGGAKMASTHRPFGKIKDAQE